jgi:TonB family protein
MQFARTPQGSAVFLALLACCVTWSPADAQNESTNGPDQSATIKPIPITGGQHKYEAPAPRRPNGFVHSGGQDDHALIEIDYSHYIEDLNRRVRRAWLPPKGSENKVIIVEFTIHRNGQVTDAKIVTSSGLPKPDAAVLKALEQAAPFRPLQDGAPAEITVQLKFNYEKIKGGSLGAFLEHP